MLLKTEFVFYKVELHNNNEFSKLFAEFVKEVLTGIQVNE
jgi:hypothetical protein